MGLICHSFVVWHLTASAERQGRLTVLLHVSHSHFTFFIHPSRFIPSFALANEVASHLVHHLFVICLPFVYYFFVICLSFVCHLFGIFSLFVCHSNPNTKNIVCRLSVICCLLFACYLLVICLSFVCRCRAISSGEGTHREGAQA